MNQLTIRGFDEQLEKCLRRLAAERRISLNRAALALMRRGAGLTERRDVASIVRGADAVLLPAVVAGGLLYGFRYGSRFEENAARRAGRNQEQPRRSKSNS